MDHMSYPSRCRLEAPQLSSRVVSYRAGSLSSLKTYPRCCLALFRAGITSSRDGKKALPDIAGGPVRFVACAACDSLKVTLPICGASSSACNWMVPVVFLVCLLASLLPQRLERDIFSRQARQHVQLSVSHLAAMFHVASNANFLMSSRLASGWQEQLSCACHFFLRSSELPVQTHSSLASTSAEALLCFVRVFYQILP